MLALVVASAKPEHIELREAPPPLPAPNEALLEVRAFGVNRGELRLLGARPDGWRPGQDIAGVVARQAADGSGPAAGTRVVACIDQAGWAELAAALPARMAPLPDGVSFEAAATLPVAGLTALRALRLGGFLLGRRVLITGATGGVGHLAVQMAAAGGAHVTAVARSQERGAGLRDLGASEVVADVEALGGTFDLILESVGGASLSAAAKLVGADGALVLFGNSSQQPGTFSFGDFGGHPRARVLPLHVYETGTATFGADLAIMADLVARGRLKPQIGFEGSWRRLDAALAGLRERRFGGKAVLRLD
jgi:NADPH:quinone reductase-like Zn-dependent oxidoreductase